MGALVPAGLDLPRRISVKLRQIGPDPVLLTRYALHHSKTRRDLRRLRRDYERTIAEPSGVAQLRIPPLDVPRVDELPEPLVPAATRLRAVADDVLAHRFDLLGSGPVSLGEEIDWHRDFKSGYRWPLDFYQDVVPTRLGDSSDAKVPWELSRSHHLLTLARAARLFEDERYATELERQLRSWLDENPPGYGINWANPMEVALRAVNWVWALRTLEASRPLAADLRSRLAGSLQVHVRHIAANLEGSPYLRSNHYLSDILGLLAVGATVDGDPTAELFFAEAHTAFEREIQSQVHDDGIGFEASLPYHGLALEIFLLAHVISTWNGRPFSAAYNQRLAAMLAASRVVRHPDGRVPQIGDGDSGRVLPAGFGREPTFDHLLWLGTAILDGSRPEEGWPHEEVAWTLGLEAWNQVQSLPLEVDEESRAFPLGGFFVMRSGSTHVVVRCGDVGQNGNGGHSHNDVLSFELWHDVAVVVDSGTYVYTSDPAARNSFRSTAAHNTVSVDCTEINPIVEHELFRLRQFARPQVELFEDGPDRIRLVASHDGFRRLQPPVVHQREFSLDRSEGSLEIRDELLGHGEQTAESFLHLAPGTRVERIDDQEFVLSHGEYATTLAWWGTSQVSVTDGWVSDRFGERKRAPVVVAHLHGPMPLRFGWRFVPSETDRRVAGHDPEVTASL
ncbi:MAG: alginate lyase family protein [Actinobacteria bacterium]|nr:alginate lyase family protein [Actinomycetota bacterium]